MKRVNTIVNLGIGSAIIMLALAMYGSNTVVSRTMTNVPPDISSEAELAVVIEDFENAVTGEKGWSVESDPRPFTSKATEEKLKMKNPVPRLEIKVIPGSPAALEKEEWSLNGMGLKKEKLLGVSFRFLYPGTNAVSILPPPEVNWKDRKPKLTYNPATGKDEQERAIQLPGRVKALSIWVMGQGSPYTLEVWVKDYKGGTHVLKLGSVEFVGWRPLKADIPVGMPQGNMMNPSDREAKITRFVLRPRMTAPREELQETAYFFFDQLKVLTNLYRPNFDGADLDKLMDSGNTSKEKKE